MLHDEVSTTTEAQSSIRPRHQRSAMPFLTALLLLASSLVVNFYAGRYATARASSPVTDLILSNTSVYEVGSLFVYSFALFLVFITALCVLKPQQAPFILKSIALFVLTRAFFISLTHLGPFPTQAAIDPSNVIDTLTFGGDFFFSGHTGLPFLMALVFWDDVRLRALFIGAAIISSLIVLLGHLHYSIDVFAAFFIAYGVFRMAGVIFKKDRELFRSGV